MIVLILKYLINYVLLWLVTWNTGIFIGPTNKDEDVWSLGKGDKLISLASFEKLPNYITSQLSIYWILKMHFFTLSLPHSLVTLRCITKVIFSSLLFYCICSYLIIIQVYYFKVFTLMVYCLFVLLTYSLIYSVQISKVTFMLSHSGSSQN